MLGSNGQVSVLNRGFSIAGVTVQPQVCSIAGPSGEIRVEPRAMDVLVEVEGELWVVDQHAAHERVMYEEVLAALQRRKGESQPLLLPCSAISRVSGKFFTST